MLGVWLWLRPNTKPYRASYGLHSLRWKMDTIWRFIEWVLEDRTMDAEKMLNSCILAGDDYDEYKLWCHRNDLAVIVSEKEYKNKKAT